MSVSEQYRALRAYAAILDRSARGRLLLTGADRGAFLQGILTNDISALESGTGCYAAYLTPQGRMLADLRVLERGDSALALFEPGVAAGVADRWSMLIFSEDVTVTDVTASWAQVGIFGPVAANVLAHAFETGHSPEERAPSAEVLESMPLHANSRWDFQGEPATVVRSDDVGVTGFDVMLPVEKKDALIAMLKDAGATAVENDVAEITRIEAGIPRYGMDMNYDTIPLEAGIEDRAISLTKGCYVGQEIIIRVLHRGGGRVAKRLVGLTFDAGVPVPTPGAAITAGDRSIGTVTSAADSPALGHSIALGYVHRDFIEPGTRVEVGENKTAATVSALPFVAVSIGGDHASASADFAP
jgi:folate-binding protein YgfZ